MSDPDQSRTAVLAQVTTEWQATLLAGVLRDHDVDAEVSGALTSQFRVEAPGYVRVIVPEAQLERARAVLVEHREQTSEIDWSQIDVGDSES